ncbi:DUF4476 domain-containing protein [Flavobacterium sp. TAB 87]|uniref:DUF4476 domain-containing protein n=1 Tax=Flavobacterium sp. TAB 87 TaxID=1729581 RepID=UPI00076C854C|nr:DUF4476 domain-containing protein [Flavobacterium sp. TAB 87]KVV14434.1 hypothetical protein AP058_02329 [Flavobacterium sp. TAB 87]
MKKLYHLSLLLLSASLFAQYAPAAGNLIVFSETQNPFSLYLNGELQHTRAQTTIRIKNLNQPYYNVKIVFEDKSLKPITKNYVSVMARDGLTFEESTYKISVNKKSKKTKMTYFSGTPIIDDYIDSTDGSTSEGRYPPERNNNTDINININTNVNSPNANNNWGSNRRHPKAMEERDFQKFKVNLKKENFDDGKINLTQNLLLNNYLNTKQIAEVASTFAFSKNQMEFVKNSYANCVDSKNYYLIKEVFTFESDQKEFMRFINNQ